MNDLSRPNNTHNNDERLYSLALRYLDGIATVEEEESLLAEIQSDAASRRTFVTLCRQMGMLHETFSTERAETGAEGADSLTAFTIPTVEIFPTVCPTPDSLSASRMPIGTMLFSYAVSALFLCLALLGAWAYKISLHENNHYVEQSPPTGQSIQKYVGRISGMRDCVWSDKQTSTIIGAHVPFDRKYALSSGLLEIAYSSGARVILEGPCEYTVDSTAGGYLASGKLTARVDSAKPQAASSPQSPVPNPQSQNPPLSTLHSPLFTVSTPTAVVTDLGTEFGVEVDRSGNTTSYVFQGIVRVETLSKKYQQGIEGTTQTIHLSAGESAEVKEIDKVLRLLTGEKTDEPPRFVRRLHEPLKYIDLLDIVAGGNGSGTRRERGIDPTTGMQDPVFIADYRGVESRFRPVVWHRLIDSVFVADGENGGVQLDSAGHEYADFPDTDGKVYGSFWSRESDIGEKRLTDQSQPWVYSMSGEEKFIPDRRGMLCFYANGGITFDLEAIRKLYPEARPVRFLATAGLGDYWYPDPAVPCGLADIWVFVDGRLKLKREQVRVRDGAFEVNVELGPADRFLTIAATDGGNGISWDSVVFGDPRLELVPTDETNAGFGGGLNNDSTHEKEHSSNKHSEALPMDQ